MIYEYKPSRYILKRAKEFSQERMVLSQNLYKWRGENSINKMQEDIICGVLGEYGVYDYIKNVLDLNCSRPDLKIYESRNKSFDADLNSDNLKIHVKSQSLASEQKYGRSWLFQRSDSLYKKPSDDDYMAFTNVCLDENIVQVLGFVHCKMIKDMKLWGECKVPKYRHSKIAIYLEDLEPYGILLEDL